MPKCKRFGKELIEMEGDFGFFPCISCVAEPLRKNELGIGHKRTSELIKELADSVAQCRAFQEPGPTQNLPMAQVENKRMSLLQAEIDERFGEGHLTPRKKTY